MVSVEGQMAVTSPQTDIVAATQDLVKVLSILSTSFLISALDENTRISLVQLATIFQNFILADPSLPSYDTVENGEDSIPIPLPMMKIQAQIPMLLVVEKSTSQVITQGDKTRDPGQRRRRKKWKGIISQQEINLQLPLSRTFFSHRMMCLL